MALQAEDLSCTTGAKRVRLKVIMEATYLRLDGASSNPAGTAPPLSAASTDQQRSEPPNSMGTMYTLKP